MDPRGEAPERRRDVEGLFGRYRGVVDDWPAFVDSLFARPDAVVWANPTRLERDELAQLFADAGIASSPLGWEGTALRLAGVERPGRHWGHWAGLYYVQEEASLLPVRLLAPRPGERVLDLCAAPGSKTARIAFALGNRGTLVANDRVLQRTAAISAAIARLGLLNVTCTIADGASYPLEAGPFDAILVDAPCSAEGAASKNAAWRTPNPEFRAFVTGTQRALLRRAAQLCRPGGRIVYSTCTFAPEENEAVLDAVLRELEGTLRVVPFEPIPGLRTSPALSAWSGQRFLPEVAGAVRLWPHVSGTGGFFAATLEKVGPSDAPPARPASALGMDPRESAILRRFGDMFGLGDALFEGHRLLTDGRLARLVADDHQIPAGPRLVSTGLPITRNRVHTAKLSTAGGLAFGPRASRRVVELDPAGAEAFQARDPVAVTVSGESARGYVIARLGRHALGLGLVRERDGTTQLESEIPTSWSRAASGRSE